MVRFSKQSWLVLGCLFLVIGWLVEPVAEAYPSYNDRIPNGNVFSCDNCHGSSSSFLGDFNDEGRQWTSSLAAMDSDNDGFSNGAELQDPDGVWQQGQPDPGDPDLVTNPSDSSSYPDPPTPTEVPTATPTSTPPPTATPTNTPLPTSTPTPLPTETPTFAPTVSPTPSMGMVGDVDDDGRITTSDALLSFRIALSLYSPTPDEEFRADADGDGRVTTADALCIFEEALSLPNDCFGMALANGYDLRRSDSGAGGEIWVTAEFSPSDSTLVATVWLHGYQGAFSDLQFDLVYDPANLVYRKGAFRSGKAIDSWPVYSDSVIEAGRIRFGALNWADALVSGEDLQVATFIFDVARGASASAARIVPRIVDPDGGIGGFTAVSPSALNASPLR